MSNLSTVTLNDLDMNVELDRDALADVIGAGGIQVVGSGAWHKTSDTGWYKIASGGFGPLKWRKYKRVRRYQRKQYGKRVSYHTNIGLSLNLPF